MEGILVKSVKSTPYMQAVSVKALPEVPNVIPKEDRELLRHSLHLREPDGAILWNI